MSQVNINCDLTPFMKKESHYCDSSVLWLANQPARMVTKKGLVRTYPIHSRFTCFQNTRHMITSLNIC